MQDGHFLLGESSPFSALHEGFFVNLPTRLILPKQQENTAFGCG
jgi:hypothetical protein